MQWVILILIGIVFFIGWLISEVSSSVSSNASNKKRNQELERERESKYKNRQIDITKSLFERNEDIINKHKKEISSSSSSSRYRYYYIDNMTRDCINEICLAEGKFSIRPNYTYLSAWKMSAPKEWIELASQIEKVFESRQKELKEIEEKKAEIKKRETISSFWNKYAELINQFKEITYRKVTTIDDYGEENWDALDKEAYSLTEKIAKREGVNEDEIKSWRKHSWSMPDEYEKLREGLIQRFNTYYKTRKNKPIESGDVTDMSGIEFENHLAQLLKSNGFDSVSGTPKTGDQGADLIAKRNGKTIIIQAKRYEGAVGNKAVQEVVGAINFYNGDEGWVITNSSFTKSARELAKKSGVKLIDGTDMQQFSEAVKKL